MTDANKPGPSDPQCAGCGDSGYPCQYCAPSDPAPGPDVREALENLLRCPALADEDFSHPDWGCSDTAEAIRVAQTALSRPVGGDQKKLNSDGQHQIEQSGKQLSPALEPWRVELDELVGHLGGAIMQSTDRDDQIIMDHVKAAHEIAKIIRRQA